VLRNDAGKREMRRTRSASKGANSE
jgi:hypothetical protein